MMDSKLTIFYDKGTGDIKAFCTGIQSMDYFGTNKDELSSIWDFTAVDYNLDVIRNKDSFCIDLATKELKEK